jgi:molybdopterin-guanine dinucleotide biosynthesis protein A
MAGPTDCPGRIAGLLLTGGASRRMGSDKALLEVDGQRLVDRAAAVLAALGAGAAAVRAARHDGPVLVLAVDMPRVTVELLRLLADRAGPETAVPRAGGHPQPMCARYGPEVLAAVDERLAAGGRSLRDLLETLAAQGLVGWVEQEEWEPVSGPEAFSDVDTPEDFRRLAEGP